MAYSISVNINEHSSVVFLNFNYLSNEFRILRICRFQCIGWILDAVAQTEVEVKSGATWINPEETVQALMRFPKVPEDLARKLIVLGSTEEKFNLVWNYISDDEKNTAITVNFDYYHNFWPGFQIYAKAISLHVANTQEQKDLKEKVEYLESELRDRSNPLSSTTEDLAKTIAPHTTINYIGNNTWHTNKNPREVVYNSNQTSPSNEFSEDIPY